MRRLAKRNPNWTTGAIAELLSWLIALGYLGLLIWILHSEPVDSLLRNVFDSYPLVGSIVVGAVAGWRLRSRMHSYRQTGSQVELAWAIILGIITFAAIALAVSFVLSTRYGT